MLLLSGERLVIAHRGDRAHAPENTVLAFERALAAGADALEIDVHVTRDGRLVVIHDERVDRTTDGRGPVESFTLASLEALDAGARWSAHPDPERANGGVVRAAYPFAGLAARIPRLDDVLDAFRQTPLIIEAKSVRAGRELVGQLTRHAARDRVIVGSFFHDALVPLREAGFRTTASRRELAMLLGPALAGRGRARVAFDAIAVPPSYRGLPLPVAGYARVTGRPVFVWTVNDPGAARRYLGRGATGIITDDPARLATIRRGD